MKAFPILVVAIVAFVAGLFFAHRQEPTPVSHAVVAVRTPIPISSEESDFTMKMVKLQELVRSSPSYDPFAEHLAAASASFRFAESHIQNHARLAGFRDSLTAYTVALSVWKDRQKGKMIYEQNNSQWSADLIALGEHPGDLPPAELIFKIDNTESNPHLVNAVSTEALLRRALRRADDAVTAALKVPQT